MQWRELQQVVVTGSRPFVQDDPDHFMHWTRKHMRNITLDNKRDCSSDGGRLYADVYEQFHRDGYALFKSCSMSPQALAGALDFTDKMQAPREPNAYKHTEGVRDVGADPDTLEILEYLHGRRSFPFQTINFKFGTQQAIHSDLVHFDTLPTRGLMAAAWVSLEDEVHSDSGPLLYYPESHHWGVWDYDEIGFRHRYQRQDPDHPDDDKDYTILLADLLAKAEQKGMLKPKRAAGVKFGESFIWAASLLHGGSEVKNEELTRRSQVTHYFFEGAESYWVPRMSNRGQGKIFWRTDVPACHQTSAFQARGRELASCADLHLERFKNEGW